MSGILTDAVAEYLADHEPPADALVVEMEDQAAEDGIPIADRSVAMLQAILARTSAADRVLEFGTAIGYSTLHIARTGTDVVTTEIDRGRINDAVEYLERDGVSVEVTDEPGTVEPRSSGTGQVTIVEGPALETVPDLAGPFQIAFIDAVKEEYEQYLDETLPKVPAGGLIVADNLLWSGHVALPDGEVPADRRESTAALQSFTETFIHHDALEALLSPLGDGTGIAVKTSSEPT